MTVGGTPLTAAEAHALVGVPASDLLRPAWELARAGHGTLVTYSPKVFIPLTKLCRDVCHYCTFAQAPRNVHRAYLTPDEVLEIARAGAAAGCHEALFTLGDKPELRYRAAGDQLRELGHPTTIAYLTAMARLVLEETGLLPHANPGVATLAELRALRDVSASQGMMLETVADRLSERGGPHFGSPDKRPVLRLATLEAAGEATVPYTTGLLIGIGETRAERIDTLLAIRAAHERHGHVGEVIVQNFRAKADTRMADAPEPSFDDLRWTVAAARLVLGPAMTVQVPPNLSDDGYADLLDAGIDDWGGVSPVTVDHVNPEAPWPAIAALEAATAAKGLTLVPRLPIYPRHVADLDHWCAPRVAAAVRARADALGLARPLGWAAG
ncbi:MAG: 7,8-didemethyl-8-hydroxy-5-deazariboflavin synthase subunit 1 / 7,8-didemethyl-8-hydroxy-5-deazariboflavin synthase subunit 2, partial [uncultured Thermoleophilia bacterium]